MTSLLNIEVSLRGSLLATKATTIRALVSPECSLTKISRRLANQLGLTEFRTVYLETDNGDEITEDISLFPVTVLCKDGVRPTMLQVYPIVSTDDNDFMWEMTIGSDILDEYSNILGAARVKRRDYRLQPTPGPGGNGNWLGTNLSFKFLRNISIYHNHSDTLFEFCCERSTSINRLAINKRFSQVFVIYENSIGSDGPVIYRYAGVSRYLEQRLENALLYDEDDEESDSDDNDSDDDYYSTPSIGKVVSEIRKRCTCARLDYFPCDTVLVNFKTMRFF